MKRHTHEATGVEIDDGASVRQIHYLNLVTVARELMKEKELELVETNRQLERLSVTDRLTGLYNRVRLDQVLDEELSRSQLGHHTFSMVLLDVDHFKSVNDTHGHPVGDQVLVETSSLLRKGARDRDIVGRWGGEEFLIICSETNLDDARDLAETLRQTIADNIFPVVGNKTCSFGVTSVRKGDTIPQMMARADAALYHGKKNGRNRVEVDAVRTVLPNNSAKGG